MSIAPVIHLENQDVRAQKIIEFDGTVFVKNGNVAFTHDVTKEFQDAYMIEYGKDYKDAYRAKYREEFNNENVRVPKNYIACIKVWMDGYVGEEAETPEYKLLDFVFRDDHLHSCHLVRLSDFGFLIWDNNVRGTEVVPEVIKFSIIVQNTKHPKEVLYLDPIIIND